MDLEFSNPVWFWKGPAPWYFVTVPEAQCMLLRTASPAVTYGWGMIPVAARIGRTTWTTSLFPKDGSYILPVRAAVRKAEGIRLDETVDVRLTVDV